MEKRELVTLLNLSSWCLLMVERLFLAVPWGCLRFVIVVFPDHTHLQFLRQIVWFNKSLYFALTCFQCCRQDIEDTFCNFLLLVSFRTKLVQMIENRPNCECFFLSYFLPKTALLSNHFLLNIEVF